MAGSFDSYQVLYSNGPPADPIRLGQLLVDESVAPALSLKYCSSLSPLTYTSFLPAGGVAPADETYVTISNETGTLPNSSRVAAGTGITLDTSVANVLTINSTGSVSGANPTASVGLTAVNGSATTYLRSDGAPALDVTIAPTWSGVHTFTQAPLLSSTSPSIVFIETDATANEGRWRMIANGDGWNLQTRLDDNSGGGNVLSVNRTGTNTDSVEIGSTAQATQLLLPSVNDPALPSLSFLSDLDTGMYRPSANNLALATGGAVRFQINGSGAFGLAGATYGTTGQLLQSNGSSAAPSWIDGTAIVVPSLATVILAQSPIGYWKLDEASGNFADSSGNSRTMTAAGSPTYQAAAIVPRETTKFVYFDATGDKGTRTDTCGFTPPVTGDWTVTCVAMTHFSAANDITVFAISGSGELEINNTQINARFEATTQFPLGTFWESGAGADTTTTSTLAFGGISPMRPMHCAWVKDGTANTVSFYINGVFYQSVAYANEPTGGGGAAVISAIHDNGAASTQQPCWLAHVAVFATALTATNIRDQAKAAGFLPSY